MPDIARARVPVSFDPAQIKKDADTALKEGAAGTALRVPVTLDTSQASQARTELQSSLRNFGGLTAEQQAPLIASQVKLNDVLTAPLEEAGVAAEKSTTRIRGLSTAASFVGQQISGTAGQIAGLAATESAAALEAGGLSAALGPAGLVVAGGAAISMIGPLISNLVETKSRLVDSKTAVDGFQAALSDLKGPNALDNEVVNLLIGDKKTDASTQLVQSINDAGLSFRGLFDEVEHGSASLGVLAHNSKVWQLVVDDEKNGTDNLGAALRGAADGGDQFAADLLRARDAGEASNTTIGKILTTTNDLSGNLDEARNRQDLLNTALAAVPTPIAIRDTSAALKALAQDQTLLQQAQGNLAATQLNAVSAPLKVADAQAQLRDAQREATSGIADQERALTDAVNSASVRLRKAQEAADEVTFAQQRAHLANAEREAEITVAQAQREALRARTPDEALAAQKSLLSAQDSLASAHENTASQAEKEADARQAVIDATNALYDAQVKQVEIADTVVDKQRAVQEAELNVEQALLNQAQANTDLRVQQDLLNVHIDTTAEKNRIYGDELNALAQSGQSGAIHDGLSAIIGDYSKLGDQLDRLVGQQETLKGTNKPGDLSGVDFSASIPAAPTHAAGGWTSGGAANFAEQGYEIGLFPNAGVYNTPPGQIINHGDSVALLQGLAGGERDRPNHIVTMNIVTTDNRRGVNEALTDIAHRIS